MLIALVLASPWLVILVVGLPLLYWRRPRLDDHGPSPVETPSVSVIVPARNEAANLPDCLRAILATAYPAVEVIVVDDRSADGTLEYAEALAAMEPRMQVVRGDALPPGWFGKPWACWQGYHAATGDLLIFTDADTRHHPELIGRAVAALRDRNANMLSGLPKQLMLSFWERLVLPQIWFVLNSRFPLAGPVSRAANPRDVIANGQFIMIQREAYEGVGGHEAVKDAVVEDVRLAQRLVEAGRRMFLVHAESFIETRMYNSLGGIVEGWTKNMAQGARLSVGPRFRHLAPWFVVLMPVALWLLPPTLLTVTLLGVGGIVLRLWGIVAAVASLLFWAGAAFHYRVPLVYALIYPAGAGVAAFIFGRSAVRGERILWKGRRYGA